MNNNQTETEKQSPYRVVEGKERYLQTVEAFSSSSDADFGRKRKDRLGHYEGLRGILMILSLLWIFFRLFAPAIVADRDIDQVYPAPFLAIAPEWQHILRKTLSPVLFNESLLASFFILFSSRICLQTFIERRSADCLAGPMFRRPFRLAIPAILALAFTSVAQVSGALSYSPELSQTLANQSAAGPLIWESTITFFNSCIDLFMDTSLRKDSRGSAFLPPRTLGWIIPIIFQQTYCVAVIAYLLPFAVLRWKIKGGIIFGLAAWWSGQWVGYSTFSILLAEFSVVYSPLLSTFWILSLFGKWTVRVPQKFVPSILLLIGLTLKYTWASIPTHRDDELIGHVDATSGSLLWNYDPLKAYPRLDDFLVVASTFVLLELSPRLRKLMNVKVLRFFGSLAYSSFLTSGTIMLTIGSPLQHHLLAHYGWGSHNPILLLLLFITTIPASLLFSLVWRLTIDDGTLFVSRRLYVWITK